MMKIKYFLIFAVTANCLITGCGSRELTIRPAPEVTRLNRVAVFPMQNLSGVPEAGDRVTHILVSLLYNSNLVNLVEPGEVQQFILRSRIRIAGELGLDRIREASHQLGADGILFGTVNEYTIITTDEGNLPSVSITLRLVDANSGEMVWSATHSLQGNFKEKVFGIGRIESVGILSEIVAAELVEALGLSMYPEKGGYYPDKFNRHARKELIPEKEIEKPVLPTAPTRAEVENIELEKERAHSAVQQEWNRIKGLE
jgi:TolB-like protein